MLSPKALSSSPLNHSDQTRRIEPPGPPLTPPIEACTARGFDDDGSGEEEEEGEEEDEPTTLPRRTPADSAAAAPGGGGGGAATTAKFLRRGEALGASAVMVDFHRLSARVPAFTPGAPPVVTVAAGDELTVRTLRPSEVFGFLLIILRTQSFEPPSDLVARDEKSLPSSCEEGSQSSSSIDPRTRPIPPEPRNNNGSPFAEPTGRNHHPSSATPASSARSIVLSLLLLRGTLRGTRRSLPAVSVTPFFVPWRCTRACVVGLVPRSGMRRRRMRRRGWALLHLTPTLVELEGMMRMGCEPHHPRRHTHTHTQNKQTNEQNKIKKLKN